MTATLDPRIDTDSGDQETDNDTPELQYGSAAEFLEEWGLDAFACDVEGNPELFRWCPQWWRHTQAASVIDALWRAWEAARQDAGNGMAAWWVYYAYPLMDRLLSLHGPFQHCRDGHTDDIPLPLTPPPEGLFPDERGPRAVDDSELPVTSDTDLSDVDATETEEEPFDVFE